MISQDKTSWTCPYPSAPIEDELGGWLEYQPITAAIQLSMIWLQQLTQLFSRTERTSVAVLSARVGSISDNELGGWYAYRSSKSALNMMLKCFAIEVKRRFRNVSVIVFHPGTTDTQLSKPFQANVPALTDLSSDMFRLIVEVLKEL